MSWNPIKDKPNNCDFIGMIESRNFLSGYEFSINYKLLNSLYDNNLSISA